MTLPRAPVGGMAVTELSFGAAPIGNMYSAVSDDDAAAAINAAWDGGIRFFDTAPHYGLGLSERRLGAGLRERPRDQYVVSTKIGRLLEPTGAASRGLDDGFDVPATHRRVWDFSRDGVLRSLDESLGRLGLDRVDILFIHDPDHHWRQAVEEAYPAVARLRDEGVVEAIGVGMNQAEMLADFVRSTDIDVVMLAGRYTLLEQGALDDLLPLCAERGVGVVAVGAFNSGLLALPRPPDDAMYNYAPAPAKLIERVRRIADVCEAHGTTLPAAALHFPLAHPAVVSLAVGNRDAAQVRRNLDLFHAPVPAGLWPALRDAGLLRSDAPVEVPL